MRASDQETVLEHRTVAVRGRRTSMRLDRSMWSALEAICWRESTNLNALCSQIDRERGDLPLTQAIRAFAARRSALSVPVMREKAPEARQDPIARLTACHPGAIIHRSYQERANDQEDKVMFSLDLVGVLERGKIASTWHAWRAARAELGRVPSFGEFSSRYVPKISESDNFNVFDVSAENPYDFMSIKLQRQSAKFIGYNASNQLVSAYPFTMHAQGMQADFNLAKMQVMPSYHLLRQRYRNLVRTYTRLVVPLSEDGTVVDTLVSVVRRIQPIHPI